jgi:hypothetical protein
MANIWLAREDRDKTSGEEPFRKLPLAECIRLLELKQSHFWSDPNKTPDFSSGNPRIVGGYQHVIVEIEAAEATPDFKAGFYRSPLSVEEAIKRLPA